jgi:hypothetical protein
MEKDCESTEELKGKRMARAFLVDVTGHLCGLIKGLQGKYKPISMI